MKKRMSRIIAIMLVLLMVVCNQSYSSMASDTDNSISEEAKTLSGENEAGYTEVATDSDAGIGVNNAVISEEDKDTDTEEDTEANDNSDEEINSDMKDIADESEVSEEGEDEKTYPLFVRSCSVDGIRVTVTASEGAFPEGATLSVNKVTDSEKEQINQAVEAVRDDSVSVAEAYTFDIKVLDENGTELQPANGQTVNVSFAIDEVSNQNLSTDIYHIPEENGSLVAEELSTSESGNTVTAVSDGFSYYTVEFTYDEKQYVMQGDSTVALVDILSFVGINKADGGAATDSDITAVSVSDESLFSASNESGEWIVTAHQAFTSNEWMKVTVDGVGYEIVVTDATTVTVNYKYDQFDSSSGAYKSTYSGITVGTNYSRNTSFAFKCSNAASADYGGHSVYITFQNAKGGDYLPTSITTSSFSGGSVSLSAYRDTVTATVTNGSTNVTLSNLPTDASNWTVEYVNVYSYIGMCYNIWVKFKAVGVASTNPTLVNTTAYYDGNPHSIGVSGGSGGTVMYSTSTDNVTWDEWTSTVPARTELGTTYVKAKVVGDDFHYDSEETGVYSITISKGNITPIITMDGWTYGSTAAEPHVSGNLGNGTETYEYKVKDAADSTYTTTKPTAIGTYTVRVTIPETTYYNGGTATTDFAIRTIPMNVTADDYTGTYDGEAHGITLTVTDPADATVKYGTSSDNYNLDTNPTYTDVGTYTVYYQITKDNHETVTGSKTVSITQKPITVTAENKSKIFGEEDPALAYSVSENGLAGSDTLSNINLSRDTGDAAGTYTINVSQSTGSNPNYNITFVPGTFTIVKKSITPEVTLSQDTYTYNREKQTPTVYVKYNGTDMSTSDYEVLYSTDGNNFITTIDSKNKGTYYIKVAAKDSGNYTFDSITKTYTINPKPIDASMVTLTDERYVYDGNEKQPVVSVQDGSIPLTDSEYEIDTSSIASATNYGTYHIVVNGKGNYTGSYTAVWSITKKAIEGVTINGVETTYDGESHKLDVTIPDNATITYGLAPGEYVLPSNPGVKDAGVHTIYYKVEIDDNYETIEGSENVVINPKAVTLTTTDKTMTYGDDDPTFGYTVEGMVGDDTLEGITFSREAGEDVGEYLISATNDTSKDTNYDITIVNTGKLTIQPKELTISDIAIDDQTYTGKELKPTVVIKDGDRIIPSTEYTVEYSDNIEPGKAKVTIKDVDGGNYIIKTIETTFNIIDPGIVEVIEPETPNANEADFAETPSEIISKIELTDDDKEAQENGKNIFVFLEVEDISETVPSADKKLVEDVISTSLEKLGIVKDNSDNKGQSANSELKIGMYLDISLFKQVEGESKVKISETSGAIKIAFEIPEALRKDGRSYYIVKVHDGVASLITPTQSGNTLTFETDQFSTYALVYMDKVEAINTPDTKVDTPKAATTPSNTTKSPTTGDMTHTGVVFILMMLSALGVVCLRFIRKRFRGR